MKRIKNLAKINNAVETLNKSFDTRDLHFEIYCYEKGEQIVSPLNPLNCFMFILTGNVRIYQLNEDSTFQAVVNLNQGGILGYHEFCFETDEYTLYAEALSYVECLILPFDQTAKQLKKDSRFLLFLLKNALLDQVKSSEIMQRKTDLQGQVLFYIQNICENHTLTNINHAVDMLHCSRRSLQRVLKKMCDDKILVHEKRGCYKFVAKNP